MILEVGNNTTKIVRDNADKLKGIDPIKLLKHYLRVRVDGYFHSVAYKKKRWDGYKSFVLYGKFMTGFLPFILKYADREGLEYTLVDLRGEIPKLKSDINTTFGDKTLREYQKKFAYTIDNYLNGSFYFPRGIFNMATNAGKTLTVEAVFSNFETPVKCLYLVHTKLLYEQAIKDFSERYDVGTVNDTGVNFKDFTVCMYQTLKSRALASVVVMAKIQEYQMIVVDECHRAASSEYQIILSNSSAPIRLFVSGTPLENKSKVKNLAIIGQSGSELCKITNKELIVGKVSLPVTVTMILNDERLGLCNYEETINSGIHYSESRLNNVVKVIKARVGKSILITVDNIAHGEWMYRELCDRVPELCFEYIHGESNNKVAGLERFKKREVDVLLASMIVKEGLNIPNISVLVRLEGGLSKITTKQLAGRGMRTDKGLDELELVDFMDIGKYIETHSRTRARDYIAEGFSFNTNYETRGKYIPK